MPEHCEGTSVMPLMAKPRRKWKRAIFSQFRKTINGVAAMGYTMRTDQFRYTEWRKRADLTEIVARELYDHRQNHDENENILEAPQHAARVKKLASQMKAGWKAARPK